MGIKDYFFFTKEERKGVFTLLVLVVAVIGIKIIAAVITGSKNTAEPQCQIVSNTANAQNSSIGYYRKYVKKEIGVLELNTADTLQLQELRGIGPAFARRIVAYRDKLGGYYAKEQLMEVYGFTPELYEKVKNQVKVNKSLIKKIDVNAYDIGYLKRHPYISYYEAKAIVDYRNSKKNHHIDSIEELKELPDLKQNFEIIRIYITVQSK